MGLAKILSFLDGVVRSRAQEKLDPDAFITMYSLARDPMLQVLSWERPQTKVPLHPVEFQGLHFRNDLGNAAGFDKDGTLLPFNYRMGAGFGIVGTVLIAPNEGNHVSPKLEVNPWTPLPGSHGAINSLGLPSKGVDYVVAEIDGFRERHQPKDFPIGASIMGHPKQEGEEKLEGTVECLRRLLPYVDFIEVNESCPNVKHGGEGDDVEYRMERLVKARDAYRSQSGRKVPLIVKLGSFGNPQHTVQFFTGMEIDGLAGLNTQKDYALLREKIPEREHPLFDRYIEKYKGGVSGEPISFHIEDYDVLKASEHGKTHSDRRPVECVNTALRYGLENIEEFAIPAKLCHWSTGGESFAMIRKHRERSAKKGLPYTTLEVSPLHLIYDADQLKKHPEYWPLRQMNPALQGREHREALIEGLRSGFIDFLATDHAPHTLDEKFKNFEDVAEKMGVTPEEAYLHLKRRDLAECQRRSCLNGTSGTPQLDTYGLVAAWLMGEHGFTPQEIARVTAYNPGRFVDPFVEGRFGKIEEGYQGSLTVLDMGNQQL